MNTGLRKNDDAQRLTAFEKFRRPDGKFPTYEHGGLTAAGARDFLEMLENGGLDSLLVLKLVQNPGSAKVIVDFMRKQVGRKPN